LNPEEYKILFEELVSLLNDPEFNLWLKSQENEDNFTDCIETLSNMIENYKRDKVN